MLAVKYLIGYAPFHAVSATPPDSRATSWLSTSAGPLLGAWRAWVLATPPASYRTG